MMLQGWVRTQDMRGYGFVHYCEYYRNQELKIKYYIILLIHFLILYLYSINKSQKYMSVQTQMIKYLNLARQFPAYYISLIDKQLQTFINNKQLPVGDDVIYQTNQGKIAWKQARKFLEKQTTLPPFQTHQGLNMSAKDHAVDLSINNMFGHTGSDRSLFSDRILKYCKKGQGAMVEIIGADFLVPGRNNAELTILGLIIDDGVPDRGHRKTIFNPQYRFIGCKSQLQNDKLITVFNITQNRLKLRGQSHLNYQNTQYGISTSPCHGQSQKSQKIHQKFRKTDGQVTQSFHHPRKQPKRQDLSRNPFDQIGKNTTEIGKSTVKQSFENLSEIKYEMVQTSSNSKKISRKKQNTKIIIQQGIKITQKITQIFYTDGTKQQNIQRSTIYI